MRTFSQVNGIWIIGWGRVHDNRCSLVGHQSPQWLCGHYLPVRFVYSVHICRIKSLDGSNQQRDSSRNDSLNYMDWFVFFLSCHDGSMKLYGAGGIQCVHWAGNIYIHGSASVKLFKVEHETSWKREPKKSCLSYSVNVRLNNKFTINIREHKKMNRHFLHPWHNSFTFVIHRNEIM